MTRRSVLLNSQTRSKQHIWPNWLRNVYPRINSSHFFERKGLDATSNTPTHYENLKELNGHQGTSKVRKVCVACNGEWISKIENDMKPIFSSLLSNESVTVDLNNQELLSTWAVIATIAAEYKQNGRVSISREDRSLLHTTSLPPEGWTVWIAKNGGAEWQHQHYRNRKIALYDEEFASSATHARPTQFNSQIAVFGIGSLALITCKMPWKNYQMRFEGGIADKLIQLYPSEKESIDWSKCISMDDDEFNFVFDFFKFKVTNGQLI